MRYLRLSLAALALIAVGYLAFMASTTHSTHPAQDSNPRVTSSSAISGGNAPESDWSNFDSRIPAGHDYSESNRSEHTDNAIDTSSEVESYKPPLPKFPRYSWKEKMEMYYNGREAAAVRYPLGLDYKGVEQLSDNVYAIDKQRLLDQSQNHDLMSHAQFDDVSGDGITVTEVVPGGLFDRMGMLPGDHFQSINGNEVHNYADLYSTYENIQGEEQVTLHLIRNGQQVDITYFIQ